MSDIPRWAYQYGGMTPFHPSPGGGWVAYADHVAAVAAAEQRGAINGVREMAAIRPAAEDWREAVAKAYDTGFADGVRDARDAVAGLPVLLVDVRFNPDDASRYVGAVNVSDALAAIDALRGES